MRRSIGLLVVVLAAGCGGAAPPSSSSSSAGPAPLRNQVPGHAWTPAMAVTPDQVVGWLGLATAETRADGLPWWVPVDAHPVVIPSGASPTPAPTPGAAVRVLPARGDAVTGRVGDATSIRYGCDGGFPVDVVPVEGVARVAPGAAWVVPAELPAGWQPTALAIADEPGATAARRAWTIGPLVVEATRADATHATFEIRGGDRRIGSIPGETYEMEGADEAAIDLTGVDPGVPQPVAAYQVAPDGPIVLIMLTTGYEGWGADAYLVGDGLAPLPSLGVGLYYCAF
ncbi:MAG: hypothetical protein H6708_00950 [Kofleriaceae bacterium]|nr:hypothetical protein [Kofleriaceae bacterium]